MQDIWQPLITIKVGSLFCSGSSQIWLEDLEILGLADPSSQENKRGTGGPVPVFNASEMMFVYL